MNKSKRIHVDTQNPNQDKYIFFDLEQDISTYEILTLKVDQKDFYQYFNADYGVLIGRVTANGGVGISNAKISVFIPLKEEDKYLSNIVSIYPYVTPRDLNADGKRYNLLPRVSTYNQAEGIYKPKQPFGSFPIKEEVVANDNFLEVYKKYYKYTALTNSAGDYMIFGVPTGTQTVHMSVDVTDIGKYSMTPASMVTNLGYSPNLFYDNNTKIKPSNDLSVLPNIETQEISVDVIPYWGDSENYTIGITRQDFSVRATLTNTFVIFGSVFTDGDNSMWAAYRNENDRINNLFAARQDGNATVSISTKRIGHVTEKIYYYPDTVSDADIDAGLVNPMTEMLVLDSSKYSTYKRDGDFVVIINCNRNKIITDDFGNEILVPDSSPNGVYTKFRGFMTLEMKNLDVPMNFTGTLDSDNDVKVTPFRYRLKFPQYADRDKSFTNDIDGVPYVDTVDWRKENFTFEAGKLYTVSRFHGIISNEQETNSAQYANSIYLNAGFFQGDVINKAYYSPILWNAGIIVTNNITGSTVYENAAYEFPSNAPASFPYNNVFGGNWMNLSVHLPQFGFITDDGGGTIPNFMKNVKVSDSFFKQKAYADEQNKYYNRDNDQGIAAGEINTKWFARSDLHWTDFVETPKTDILLMNDIPTKGFKELIWTTPLTGKYRNGMWVNPDWSVTTPCPIGGGHAEGNPENAYLDDYEYFYKGLDTANCIEFVISLGLV